MTCAPSGKHTSVLWVIAHSAGCWEAARASSACLIAATSARVATSSSVYADPVILQGRHVRLEPMLPEHAAGLFEVMRDDEDMWRYLPQHMPHSVCDTGAWMRPRLELRERGLSSPFTVFSLADDAIAGTTSYSVISEANRSLEIGGTAYGRAYRRTVVNTECKYLLLGHAFEALGCIRVTFHTDARNERSQRAIERIGGVREGV